MLISNKFIITSCNRRYSYCKRCVLVRFVLQLICTQTLGISWTKCKKAFTRCTSPLEGQTEFVCSKEFRFGDDQLKVFVNGILQEPGEDKSYVEVDEKTIRFNRGLEAGEIVTFYIPGVGSGYISPYGRWREPVATRDDLPETAVEGDTRVVLDEKVIVVFKGGDWNNINIGVEDIEGFIDALDFLVEHAETQSGNPHNVTAEEVGAYTKEAVDQRLCG